MTKLIRLAYRFGRIVLGFAALANVAGCGGGSDDSGSSGAGGVAAGGAAGGGGAGGGIDPNGNSDGDCMTNAEELAKGTNPNAADTDGDGDDDCKEIACKSDPTRADQRCYKCGWPHGDPGNFVSTGVAEGDVVENIPLVDQCGDTVPLWDFAGEYHILFMTAVW